MIGLRKRLTYANAMSSIALFVALGGGAYATTQLQKNSVGASQLKANSVTSGKVKNGSLLSVDFKAGQIPAGAAGASGPAGPKGDTGAAGPKGDTGAPGPFPATLPVGQTITGAWGFLGDDDGTGTHEGAATAISFPYPLAASPTVNIVQSGATPPAACPGTVSAPAAAPGNLCIFVGVLNSNASPVSYYPFTANTKYGVVVYTNGTAVGRIDGAGSWAVTG
jgi:hypothetical protein